MKKHHLASFVLLFACAFGAFTVTAQTDTKLAEPAVKANGKIPWTMTVVIMDGADRREKAEIPVKEAVEFIEKNSRFDFEVRYVVSNEKHGFTPYVTPPNRKRGEKRAITRYAMMGWNVSKPVINSLPVSTSYLFLYKMGKRLPAQAGSSLGLDFGLIKGGKPRPYSTVPVDMWWFVNTPKMGFKSWAAQVLTHEIVNSIQARLEAKPYRCGQLTSTPGLSANIYEAERLQKIKAPCYAKLDGKKD